jgi:hypothetical protein
MEHDNFFHGVPGVYFSVPYSQKQIVETNGDTEWLKHGTPHCNVRRDFFDTDVGVKRLQNVIVVESESSAVEEESSMSY